MQIIRIFLLAVLLVFGCLLAFTDLPVYFLSGSQKKAWIESSDRMARLAQTPNTLQNWPPELGEPFPEVALFDHRGDPFQIETLRGKPVLMEFIAMTCAGCQAWSGGNELGAFENLAVQEDLESIEHYYRRYVGRDLFAGDISFLQLVIYNVFLEPPHPRDLRSWRSHFELDSHPNAYVVSGGKPLANGASFRRIPGFLVLDSDLIVRYDSLGHTPRHNLYRQLLPGLAAMLESR